jgi:hypothetical protein
MTNDIRVKRNLLIINEISLQQLLRTWSIEKAKINHIEIRRNLTQIVDNVRYMG